MEKYTGLEIAIIGMAGRFPEADNIIQYWENLQNEKDCISDFTEEEIIQEGESESQVKSPSYVKSNAYVKNKKYFDSEFFGYTPHEAELMDPQVRIYHECCWEALEDSGYTFSQNDKVGVFSAASPSVAWQLFSTKNNQDNFVDGFTASHLRDATFLSSRISYKFNLKGPAILVHTACSSSLVSIHQACSSLLLGECNIAVAGGVNIVNYSKKGYLYQEGMIHSKDGRCRPFDAKSSGTVGGEGAGVVILKRLKDAIKDRDNIYAIIKGSAINNDGSNKVGYTAPSVKGQAEVIRKAQRMAKVEQNTIGYIETHGTATSLGDSIEIEALNEVFGNCVENTCAIGSVKSNIGHLDTAAGVAGFIKTVLAVKNRKIPASLHFEQPNPRIDFGGGPFYVNNTLREWKSNEPLRAGVSSFGIGGTNAHIILQEAPVAPVSSQGRKHQLLVLSAKTKTSLKENTVRLNEFLKQNENTNIADAAYTLQKGRERFKYRKTLVCRSREDAVEQLMKSISSDGTEAFVKEDLQNIILMFPGQGTQYSKMCKDLYTQEKVFRTKIDECLSIAAQYSSEDFRSFLFQDENSGKNINDTEFAQPLLFIVEYALARLLEHWGIQPDYMIGHSIGEYVAACLSGVFSLSDAIRLVIKRGELMGRAEKGSMLSIEIEKENLNLAPNIDIAVINSRKSLVVSGADKDIEAFSKELDEKGISNKKIHTSHAFHSRMMDSILDEFEKEFRHITISKCRIPYISNTTGEFVTDSQVSQPSYWSSHLRNTVDFFKGTENLLKIGGACFIEAGPGRTLSNYLSASSSVNESHTIINIVRHAKQEIDDHEYLLGKLGNLWEHGVKINWDQFYEEEERNKVSLPPYAFDQLEYVTNFNLNKLLSTQLFQNESSESFKEIKDYINSSHWKTSIHPNKAVEFSEFSSTFLVFSGDENFSSSLIQNLQAYGQNVIQVRKGISFSEINEDTLEVNIGSAEDVLELWKYLSQKKISVNQIIYCLTLDEKYQKGTYDNADKKIHEGYLGLCNMAQSIAGSNQEGIININILSNHLAQVTQQDEIDPLKAMIYAPVQIIPSEISNARCKIIDIPYPFQSKEEQEEYSVKIENELFYEVAEACVAYRHHERWVQVFEQIHENPKIDSDTAITEKGTYLIIGGTGGIGLSIAGKLASDYNADIILVHKSEFPERKYWSDLLESEETDQRLRRNIQKITDIESHGGRVVLYRADITNEDQVQKLILKINNEYPTVNGLIWGAGEVDYGGIILNRSKEDFISYSSSKVQGLLLFEKYFDLSKLDFLALFSSVGNAIYQAKFGQVAYNAGNMFLENYAYAARKSGINAFTINWCDWFNTGLTYESVRKAEGIEEPETINSKIHNGIYPEKGIQVFFKCLQNKAAVYTIYPQNLNDNITEQRNKLINIQQEILTTVSGLQEKEQGSLEEILTDLFSVFFGKKVNLENNFFELGGDSLKAMNLIARVNQKIGSSLTISDVYKFPTIRELIGMLGDLNLADRDDNNIPRAGVQQYYTASAEQKRMYFLQSVDEKSTLYNETEVLRISGKIDLSRIENIFTELIRRHESLRTILTIVNGELKQEILDDFFFELKYLPYEENRLNEIIRSFVRPFDLSADPLLRVAIIEKNPEEFIMVMDSHHSVMDGVSRFVLREEFNTLYTGEELQPMLLQYKDYAEWQNSTEQKEKINKQKEFWLGEFSDTVLPLELPIDFPRPLEKNNEGDFVKFKIGKEDSQILKNLASETGGTMYTILLTLLNVLFSKLGNQEDIVIGTPVSGRHNAALEGLIGMFVNTICLRNYPRKEIAFNQFLSEVKDRTLASLENQSYQFEELVSDLKIERDERRNPLFDIMFVYQNYEESKQATEDLIIKPENLKINFSRFDLTLLVIDENNELDLRLIYSTELFKRETVERLVSYFREIVSQISGDHTIRLSDIDIIPSDEKEKLLVHFNDTKAEYPHDKSVLDIFMEQVKKSPDAVALIHGYEKLSFQQLNDKADVIAHKISSRIHGTDHKIGLHFTNSVEMIAAILGVIKTGNTYIPLSAEDPADRKRYIMEDCEADLLLVQELLNTEENQIVSKDKVLVIGQIEEKDNALEYPMIAVSPEALVYIIYTSGTTGQPKGVEIRHRNLANYASWNKNCRNITPQDVGLQLLSYHFDGFCYNFYSALLSGAAIVTIPDVYKLDTSYIADMILEHKTTFFAILPGLYDAILDEFASRKVTTNIRFAVLAGEKTPKALITKSKEILPEVNLENGYGPTETTIGCIHNPDFSEENISIIGKPISNTSVYILGENEELVPIGVSGEICISGAGVGRGYVNKPGLTSEKFVDNPFLAHEKIYKTGDLGRWHTDGTIEILGRKDDQIKIRGYRVELEEIANQIMHYGSVSKCVVVLLDKNGTLNLAAYYTSEYEISPEDMNHFLSERIPEYMIPVFYVKVDEFTYTINGKLDKRALPLPQDEEMQQAEPETKTEKLLIDIWRQVLVSEEIGVMDNFFSVGGDSIKSIQVSSRLRAYGYEVSVKEILKSKNIRALAAKLKTAESTSEQSEIVGEVGLSPIQKWFFTHTVSDRHHFNQSVLLNFPQGIQKETVEKIFNVIQSHHDTLRMTFDIGEDIIIQKSNSAAGFPVSIKEFDLQNEPSPEEILESESRIIQKSVDLENGPLMNLGLFHMNDGSRLLIVIHHLVIDGVSWRILFEDIKILLQQITGKEALVLPLKTDSFRSWTNNLKAYMQNGKYDLASSYWDAVFQKSVAHIERDHPDGKNLFRAKASETFSLNRETTMKLLTEVHRPFNTQMNDVLLAAFLLAVNKLYGYNQVLVDLETHGRHSLGQMENVNRTIGWFTGFYPVLLRKEDQNISGIIKKLKESLRNIPNQGIDYMLKKYYSDASGGYLSNENAARISFNYLGQFDAEFENGLFTIAYEEKGDETSENKVRDYDWDVSGIISNGELAMTIIYGKEQYNTETIQKLMSLYEETILEVVNYCCNYKIIELTPSDLTYKKLSLEHLSELQKKYEVQDVYPLSPMQEGILFHTLYDLGSSSYFGQMTFEIERDLDLVKFEESVNQLVSRHDILRTVFLHEGYDRPIQLLLKNRRINVEFSDVRDQVFNSTVPEIIEKYKQAEKLKPFDLQADSLMSFRILQLADQHYSFIWNYHHILMDGWCTSVILDEFRQIYSRNIRKQTLHLPPADPYLNYIQWLENKDKNASETYWKEKLNGYHDLASMPKKESFGDKKPEFIFDYQSFTIEKDETKMLYEMASQYGITLNTIIQFVWGMLLARYNGTDDVIFGTVVSGRPSEIDGIESMIGLFINTIPVRIRYSSEDSLSEALQKIQADTIEGNGHQYHPLSEIQTLSPLGRNLLDHIIIVENYPMLDETDESIDAVNCREDFPVRNVEMYVESNYDLVLVVAPFNEIEVKLEFNANVYADETIENILAYFNQIIRQIILHNVKHQTV